MATAMYLMFLQGAVQVWTVRDGSQIGWHGQRVTDKGKGKDRSA